MIALCRRQHSRSSSTTSSIQQYKSSCRGYLTGAVCACAAANYLHLCQDRAPLKCCVFVFDRVHIPTGASGSVPTSRMCPQNSFCSGVAVFRSVVRVSVTLMCRSPFIVIGVAVSSSCCVSRKYACFGGLYSNSVDVFK